MRFDTSPRSLWRLCLAVLIALVVAVAVGGVAYLSGVLIDPLVSVLIAVLVAALVWVTRAVTMEASGTVWDPPSVEPAPVLPRVAGVTRLARSARDASGRRAFTGRELARTLHAIAAERLVRRHGADPRDPFASARGLLSPPLLAFLTATEESHPPSVSRRTLDAYLKEIDAL